MRRDSFLAALSGFVTMLVLVGLLASCSLFKTIEDYYDHQPTPAPAPTAAPTVTPPPAYCTGSEVACVAAMTPATLAAAGVTVIGGILTGTAYQPAVGGGLLLTRTVNTAAYRIEIEVADWPGGIHAKGFLLSAADRSNPYYLAVQVASFAAYGDNVLRGYLAIAPPGEDANKYAANLITAAAFGSAYSLSHWGPEAHTLRLIVRGGQYQITIDDNFMSVWAGRENVATGRRPLTIVLGNSVEPAERFLAFPATIRRFKIVEEVAE